MISDCDDDRRTGVDAASLNSRRRARGRRRCRPLPAPGFVKRLGDHASPDQAIALTAVDQQMI